MVIRQPIVSVLGHVDHGKTSLLDYIRGSTVVEREAGLITQHIGATEVPIEHIYEVCADLIGEKKFSVPGLLFIDTPGHQSFTSLRARGGSLADLAVLVVDVREGMKPQTVESLSILKRFKTPFVVALNKIDLISGWVPHPDKPFILSLKDQHEDVAAELDNSLYNLSARLHQEGISAERYDRIDDFTKNFAVVPVSAKTGEGIPDLLLVLIGLAQRFLETELKTEEGPGRGTILEVKEERGLGPALDVIVYSGTIARGDTVALGTTSRPLVTKVKAILKPRPLDEIRDPREKFDSVKEVSAAAGVKVLCQTLEGVVAGAPLKIIMGDRDEVIKEIEEETRLSIPTSEDGILIKADAIGSLEALAYEAHNADIPIKKFEVGAISRRDIVEASAYTDPLHKAILGFNVEVLPEAREAVLTYGTKVFTNDVLYRLFEDYQKWVEEQKREIEAAKRSEYAFPGKVKVLPNCVFRVSKPAIVGVRVLSGRVRPGQMLISVDGREVGKIRSIRTGEDALKEAIMGAEVAIGIEGATVGRQVNVEDILYVEIPESRVKELEDFELNADERMTLDELMRIKRKEDRFWGM
ncbi:MAG: translation initiation factor IF-2 [Methanomassiliicoccales archaeon]|nr:translation initiation factor IF-2 [Methanomassiliicoccales archaeon]